jgi:glucose-1-phosphate adenylyltransferase
MQKTLAVILAGGAGERIKPLTRSRSKAAVPFAGKYRLIDFTLSNCINSGVRRIFVLTQYLSESLNRHIQEGWSISSSGLGDFIYCVPAQMKTGADWFQGTADAVRQNMNLFQGRDFEDVLILAGDHIYKMDYSLFLNYHRQKGADLSISALRTPKDQAAGRLGVMEVDNNYRLMGFEEKPAEPKTLPSDPGITMASMGIYLFKVEALWKALNGPGADFGKNIIPETLRAGNQIYIYDYAQENHIQDYEVRVEDGVREKVLVERIHDSCCWRDVGTLDSFYEASMSLTDIDPDFNLYGEKWPFRTFQRQLPPTKYVLGGQVKDSIVSTGCIISGGWVFHSVLSPGVIVERNATVEHSVIFDDVVIEPGARIRKAIVDKECRIHARASIGYNYEADRERGCTVTASGIVVVPKGLHISRYEALTE